LRRSHAHLEPLFESDAFYSALQDVVNDYEKQVGEATR
jgi:hypothetical protein